MKSMQAYKLYNASQVKEGKWVAGRAVQYYDVAGYLVGRPAGAFTLFITIVSLVSTSKHPSCMHARSKAILWFTIMLCLASWTCHMYMKVKAEWICACRSPEAAAHMTR